MVDVDRELSAVSNQQSANSGSVIRIRKRQTLQPLFTVHGGEYLTASYIEENYKHVNVWIPSRDRGVDLLVSDRSNRRTVSLQVKFSKDYLVTHGGPEFQKKLRSCGYWTINSNKLRKSAADYWVFVLPGFELRSTDYIIVPSKELWQPLRSIHGSRQEQIRSYLWVTEANRCWEVRRLKVSDRRMIANGMYRNPDYDFTRWLNKWDPLAQLNKSPARA